MYKSQKGCMPTVSRFVGVSLLLYSFLVLFRVILGPGWQEGKFADLEQLALLSAVALPTAVFGLLVISVFPEVRLCQVGLRYRVILYYGVIKWAEIENAVELKNGIVLLALKRKGLYLLNGLLFQRLIGYFLRHEHPVLLLAPGLDQRERILEEIFAHSSVKQLRRFDDPYS